MYPNQSPNQTPPPQNYSIDYLDQISAPQKTSRLPNPKFLIGLIVGLLLLLTIVGAFILLNSRSTPMDKATTMYSRMVTLEKIAKSQHRHLRDGQLRSTNSSYSLFLTNAIRDLKGPLENADVNLSRLPESVKNADSNLQSELANKFDNARLNVELDRVYAREMDYQLDLLHGIMVSIYNSTNNQALRDYLQSTENNLAQISDGFGGFSGAK